VLDFTRASSATARTATGKIQEVLPDEQRLVGNREGLLIEEQRTNLHTHSQEFTNSATWKLSSLAVEGTSHKAPDGTLTAVELIAETSSGYLITQSNTIATTSGVNYVASIWVNNVPAGTEVRAINGDGSSLASVTLPVDVTEWTRVSVPYTADATGFSRLLVRPNVSGVTFHVWGAQLEEGSFPTSYIPTQGTQVTRAADDCVRVLGDEFNRSNFTAFVDVESALEETNATALAIFSNVNNRIELRYSESSSEKIRFEYIAGGIGYVTEVFDYSPSRKLLAVSVDVNTGTVKFGYGGQASKVLVSLPNLIGDLEIKLAESTFITSRMNAATFRSVQIFPRAFSEAELVILTGGD